MAPQKHNHAVGIVLDTRGGAGDRKCTGAGRQQHFSGAHCLLRNLLCATHCEAKGIQRRGKHVDPAARVPGFESPLGVMLSQWYLHSQAHFVYR